MGHTAKAALASCGTDRARPAKRALAGKLAEVGDTLAQRFKAVEQASRDGNWSLAKHLEVIPTNEVGTTSQRERQLASCLELKESKLTELSNRVSRPRG